MNFVLEEKKINKKTEVEYWDTVGYYATLEQVLVGMFRKGLQESEAEGVKAIIDEIRVSTGIILEQVRLLEDENKRTGI